MADQHTDAICDMPGCGKPLSQHPHPYIPEGGDRRHSIITAGREAHFSRIDLNPATQLYITVEDRLRVQVFNSLAGVEVDVSARLQLVNGQVIPIRLAFFPTANRAGNTFDTDLSEGFLLDLTVSTPTAACRVGHTFVVASIIRGNGANAISSRTIISNYVNTGNSIGWPEGPNQQSVQGAGVVKSVNVSNPAAGADWSVAVPTGARWQLQCWNAVLTTSAAVANRLIFASILDPAANTVFLGQSNFAITASHTPKVSACGGIAGFGNNFGTNMATPDVASYIQGYSIGTFTQAMDVADQWSSIWLSIIEWLEQ